MGHLLWASCIHSGATVCLELCRAPHGEPPDKGTKKAKQERGKNLYFSLSEEVGQQNASRSRSSRSEGDPRMIGMERAPGREDGVRGNDDESVGAAELVVGSEGQSDQSHLTNLKSRRWGGLR